MLKLQEDHERITSLTKQVSGLDKWICTLIKEMDKLKRDLAKIKQKQGEEK